MPSPRIVRPREAAAMQEPQTQSSGVYGCLLPLWEKRYNEDPSRADLYDMAELI